MRGVASSSATERAELFRDAAEALEHQTPELIEKDFWVVWTLRRLFSLPLAKHLLFKGGTSLSKVYDAISRFSEDIDLSFDRAMLGLTHSDADLDAMSGKERGRQLDRLSERTVDYLELTVLPALRQSVGSELGDEDVAGWGIGFDPDDPTNNTLLFQYPVTDITPATGAYVAPRIKLEFGARSDHWPVEEGFIRPYIHAAFPDEVGDSRVAVRVLGVQRTFWEKITILHSLAYGGAEKVRPFLSRHYYDVAELQRRGLVGEPRETLALLEPVAAHKARFFPAAWARYDLARAGTLKLVPEADVLREVERDYDSMRVMILGPPPPFDEIVESLRTLEESING